MGEYTPIEWADTTINFAWGCTKVSKGCEKCYMFRLSRVYGRIPYVFQPRKIESIKKDLNKYKNEERIIFLNSMTDTFHEHASIELIESWFKLLEQSPKNQFIILTKRINKAYVYFKTHTVPSNCWIGTSIEDKGALHRLATLKRIKARIKFVSFEPLFEDMGQVDLRGIDWAIVGGESDFIKPRPFDVSWARNIRDICKRDNVAFFYKQSGGTKKIGGCWGTNTIDGKTYLEMPMKLHTKESTQIRGKDLNLLNYIESQ